MLGDRTRAELEQDAVLVSFLMWFMAEDEMSADHARRVVAEYRDYEEEKDALP